jgi:hypothetical protein
MPSMGVFEGVPLVVEKALVCVPATDPCPVTMVAVEAPGGVGVLVGDVDGPVDGAFDGEVDGGDVTPGTVPFPPPPPPHAASTEATAKASATGAKRMRSYMHAS